MKLIRPLTCGLILTAIVGCTSIGPCSYDLPGNGWSPTELRPDGLPKRLYESPGWFLDAEESILVCHDFDARNFCGGIYSVYKKVGSAYVEDKEIVCIT